MKLNLILLSGATLLMAGTSFAHEGEMHMEHVDAPMARLHEIMPKYAAAQAAINTALGKEDIATVQKEAGYILSTTADLKKSKPHKRVDQLKEFRAIAGRFEGEIKSTAEMARKGNVEGAKKYFSRAEKQCVACPQVQGLMCIDHFGFRGHHG